MRRYLLILITLAVLVVLSHLTYLYFQVSRNIHSSAGEVPAIFYGRPTQIRIGDHLGNLRFAEHLQRLSYRKVKGKPASPGTFSQEATHIRIFLRQKGVEKISSQSGLANIYSSGGRVVSLISATNEPLDSIYLEPEEIGRIMGPGMESRRPVTLSDVSLYLQKAVIASEDARFYTHFGIDVFAISRSIFVNIRERRLAQGGSTITQQLAKNFFLSPKKTFGRKLREAELAFILELRYSKKQILEMYLNKIYFGQDGLRGIYGIEEAAGFYFSKSAKDLSLEESALLAGIIRSPRRYARLRDRKAAEERRNFVLTRMHSLKMISEDEFNKAIKAPLQIAPYSMPSRPASYFVDYIQRITAEELGEEKLFRTGYRFYTTLDSLQQAAAEEAVTNGLAEIEKSAFPAAEPLQAALVAVDTKTGEMTAMVGGRSYIQSHFNRAVDARRQPGSAFKPFVLLAALSQSLKGRENKTLATLVSGDTISIPTPEGIWTPANYENKAYAEITIRKAIEDSVNTATVRLANDVGFNEVLQMARTAGIVSPLTEAPSMALGSFEVTPLELAYAYTTIAAGGIKFAPFPLFKVTTVSGTTVIERTVDRKQAIDPRIAYLAGYALEGVLARGTAREAKTLGIYFPAAGKTGTTNGNRDSWFVGYTPDVVCAVWVGFDSGGDTGLTGAKGALHIWSRFLRALYPQSGPRCAKPPEGVETAVIDPESGYLATAACPQTLPEAFLTGTAPAKTCPLHPVSAVANTIRKGIHSVGEFFRNLFK